ncbi:MAG: Uma2 family endonuclease [Fimbriiglobus sp.]
MTVRPASILSVTQYMASLQSGHIKAADRVELIRGRIVEKMSINGPHNLVTNLLADLLRELLPNDLCLFCPSAIILEDSVPEPDIIIARGKKRDFTTTHPTAADIQLLVEVSDTSLAQDLGDKLTLYALAKIPEYWVVDIPHRQIHVFTKPKGGKKPGYKSQVTYSDVDSVPVFDVSEVKVSEVLP